MDTRSFIFYISKKLDQHFKKSWKIYALVLLTLIILILLLPDRFGTFSGWVGSLSSWVGSIGTIIGLFLVLAQMRSDKNKQQEELQRRDAERRIETNRQQESLDAQKRLLQEQLSEEKKTNC